MKKKNINTLYSLNEIVNENHEFRKQDKIFKIINKNKTKERIDKVDEKEKKGRL